MKKTLKKNKVRNARKRGKELGKRNAIAPIISTILLLGFAVALGTGVYLWQARQTEQLGKSMVRYASGVLDCQSLNFNAQSKDGCTRVTISNNGYFNIDSFVVRSFSSFGMGSEFEMVFVRAQGSTVLDVGLVDAEKVEVMPIVKVKGELVGCKDKVRQVDCKGLDDIQKEACNTADSKGTCSLLDGSGIVTQEECCKVLEKCC